MCLPCLNGQTICFLLATTEQQYKLCVSLIDAAFGEPIPPLTQEQADTYFYHYHQKRNLTDFGQ